MEAGRKKVMETSRDHLSGHREQQRKDPGVGEGLGWNEGLAELYMGRG